jgi:hypothetical protein
VSLIRFVQSRVTQGHMLPVALSRANTLVRRVDPHLGLQLRLNREPPLPATGKLHVEPITLRDAGCMVNLYHRHHTGDHAHLFSLGCFAGGRLVGAATVGRPKSRVLDNGSCVEITRLVSDGTRNVCSKLLGAARRAAGEDGYSFVVTYTLPNESGASLRAAGFICEGAAGGGTWNRRSRRRQDRHPTCIKLRWRSAVTLQQACRPPSRRDVDHAGDLQRRLPCRGTAAADERVRWD